MSETQRILQTCNLNIGFGNQEVVKDLSFDVWAGQTTALVGESGSGKSVTALAIMGLLSGAKIAAEKMLFPSTQFGEINLAAVTPPKMQQLRGKEIGMVFQDPLSSLNPLIRIGEQVTEHIVQHLKVSQSIANQRCIEIFEAVQLPRITQIIRSYPHELSGGQKQRIMLAIALACNPKLLICDEPTTALDVSVQHALLHLLRDLQEKRNIGIIFISHDLGLVRAFGGDVVVLYRGKCIEKGNTKAVFSNPKHPYTQALLACRPSIHKKLDTLPTVADFWPDAEPVNYISSSKPNYSASPKQGTILSVENLCVKFYPKVPFWKPKPDPFQALNKVNFNVSHGTTLGIVGESGCGKTTLVRTILGLQPSVSGKIRFEDIDISHLTENSWKPYRKRIQLVFQDPYSALNPRITIGSAISEVLRVHKIVSPKEVFTEAIQLLSLVGLPDSFYYRFPHQLSGGQRQRVVIARALATRPELLICDEAVSALDVSVQAQIINLIKQLQNMLGVTCLFISHDLAVIRQLCEYVLVMDKGIIVETGTTEAVLTNPKHEKTQQLITAAFE
ncbi:MAG: ABC transporter ATP-binding protein [Bacteroidia bacterium]|nr:ABC transporter ATP-binding protein [Bacteroidia bacterium]